MRFATLLLTGLLAASLHAAETHKLKALRVADQKPDLVAVESTTDDVTEASDESMASGDMAPPETSDLVIQHDDQVMLETGECSSCCGSASGHHAFHGKTFGHCPWRSRCNMPQHMPYFAQPSTYYYFRPYNYMHIAFIQEEALYHAATAANPYDTDLFEHVYEQMAAESESLPTP